MAATRAPSVDERSPAHFLCPQIRAEARRMREMLVEMQTALQKAVEENSSSRGAAEKAAQLERQVASLSAEKGRAEERCREQEKEIEALTARLREVRGCRSLLRHLSLPCFPSTDPCRPLLQADSLACLARGEAQASLAEAATLRDAIQRNVVEMEQARETTSHGKGAVRRVPTCAREGTRVPPPTGRSFRTRSAATRERGARPAAGRAAEAGACGADAAVRAFILQQPRRRDD